MASELAESILRKVIADTEHIGCVFVERYENGSIAALIDTSWFGITAEEADYLDSLQP